MEGGRRASITKPIGEQEETDIFDIDCVTTIIRNGCGEDLFGTNDLVYVQT
jgi:hypothetical protein